MRALAIAVALSCTLPGALRAEDAGRLGEPGQWLIRGSAGGTAQWESWEHTQDAALSLRGLNGISLWIAPAALLFVTDDLALGAHLWWGFDRYSREDGADIDVDGLGAGLQLAYHVELDSGVFFLPELGLGATFHERLVRSPPPPYPFNQFAGAGRSVASNTATLLRATLSIPLGFVLAPRFYAGLGPYVSAQWGSGATPRGDDWSLALGLVTMFGTWL